MNQLFAAPKQSTASYDSQGWLIEPKNFSHAVYLVIEAEPNLKQSEIRNVLKALGNSVNNLHQAINDLFKGGYIAYSNIKGAMHDPDDRLKFRWRVTDKVYKPKAIMKKIKPLPVTENAPSLPKIDEHKPTKRTPELHIVQGIATVDADHPQFGEIAKTILDATQQHQTPVKVEAPKVEEKRLITGIFIDIDETGIVLTPEQFMKLFKEMKTLIEG